MNPLRWAKAEVLHFAWKNGRYTPPDRRVLERDIFPALSAEANIGRVLSVGVAWYTERYARAFADKTFVTLDLDPSRAAFGATGASSKHIVGDLRNLEQLVEASEPFDLVLMNGVIGYGLDRRDDVDRALRACAARMRVGATLVLGINEEKPTNVDPMSVGAHALFEPRALGPWPSGRVTIDVPFRERTHTFLFWRRR